MLDKWYSRVYNDINEQTKGIKMNQCIIEGCTDVVMAKELCITHYGVNWRSNHEGHTYLDKARGYIYYIGHNHPVTNASGITGMHRLVLWDSIGPGEHKCYWGCGKTVSWDFSLPHDGNKALVVDHINGNKSDNRPENLVPSCQGCNSRRANARGVNRNCSFDGCKREWYSKEWCRQHYTQQLQGRPIGPIREVKILLKDDNGRVCTECEQYKTWDNFLKNAEGRYRSKCRSCFVILAKRNQEKRRNVKNENNSSS